MSLEKEFIENAQKILIGEREKCKGKFTAIRESLVENSQRPNRKNYQSTSAEAAAAAMEQNLQAGMAGLYSRQIDQIDAALLAIEKGTYGNCSCCEGEIAEKRLKAVPWAVRCVNCEELHARGLV